MANVYKPSKKLLNRDKSFSERDRFVKNSIDSVYHYCDGTLIQSDLLWRGFPDSHAELTNESEPTILETDQYEYDHAKRNGCKTPKLKVI